VVDRANRSLRDVVDQTAAVMNALGMGKFVAWVRRLTKLRCYRCLYPAGWLVAFPALVPHGESLGA
jgi:hypothetical protein